MFRSKATTAEGSGSESRTEPKMSGGTRSNCVAFVGDLQSHGVVSAACQHRYPALSVRDGGSREALEYLAEGAAPRVLIVDVSDAAKPLTAVLPIVAAFDDTKVIALGSVNDINVYREMVEAGVQDYLVKPITERALADVLDRVEEKMKEAKEAKEAAAPARRPVIAVLGTRGGVGASTVAVNCAWLAADTMNTKTMLLDLDLQYGTIALALDIEPTRGLREALQNPGRIDSLFISSASAKVSDTLTVMAAEEAPDDEVRYDESAVVLLLDELRRQADCIIVDLPRHAAGARARALGQATDVLLVTDLTLAGLRDAIRHLGLVQQHAGTARLFVIANRSDAPSNNVPRAEFEKALGRKIDFVIVQDSKASIAAANSGKPLAAVAASSKAVAPLRELTKELFSGNEGQKKKKTFWQRSK